MKPRDLLGHIDCPVCGTAGGMRVTADKNLEPFGYCEADCSAQLRVGGDARRVRRFLERFPHLRAAEAAPAPAAPAPAPVAAAPAPTPTPRPKRPPAAGMFDALLSGVKA